MCGIVLQTGIPNQLYLSTVMANISSFTIGIISSINTESQRQENESKHILHMMSPFVRMEA